MRMENIVDTNKGEYLSSPEKIQWSQFHNEIISQVSKSFVTIHDSEEGFWGCGGLIEYKSEKICIHFIITAAHVIKDLCDYNKNSKIIIPFDNLAQENKNLSLTVDLSLLPKLIDCVKDIALIRISPENFSNTGYTFFELEDKQKTLLHKEQPVLILGIPWNRIKRAYRKNREINTNQIVVNGFQFPTKITKVDDSYFCVAFPNDVEIYKNCEHKKGRNIDPS